MASWPQSAQSITSPLSSSILAIQASVPPSLSEQGNRLVEPDVTEYPALAGEFVFGPIVPSQFRLSGHGAFPDGEARLRAELAGLGRDPAAPHPEELDMLRALASAETPYPAVLRALTTLQPD